ncbi:MAG: alpha/beta hydrolase [Acetobacteraceae bacterium]|nr:alpha/beta hydrolase [Acetobacteraceae bacterium]MSP30739.1 alpha/beta hydrolase [Acetobacteraceae bacterium]
MTNFVLVHGSFQGGWIWRHVEARLRAAGHVVFAPTLDGCGERRHQLRAGIDTTSHATEIAELLFYENLRDVVLVGTSSGGMVVCRAAEQMRARISRLVLVDALALFPGERTRDIVKRSSSVPSGLAAGPSREDAERGVFAGLDPATMAWVLDRYTPHPIGCSETPVRLTDFWDLDWNATVIWCRQAENPGEAHQRRAAARLKAKWIEIETGHYPMLSMPDDLTKLIIDG